MGIFTLDESLEADFGSDSVLDSTIALSISTLLMAFGAIMFLDWNLISLGIFYLGKTCNISGADSLDIPIIGYLTVIIFIGK